MLDRQKLRMVAARANVDARTVERAIQGRTKSAATRDAIVRALREEGLDAEARALETKGRVDGVD